MLLRNISHVVMATVATPDGRNPAARVATNKTTDSITLISVVINEDIHNPLPRRIAERSRWTTPEDPPRAGYESAAGARSQTPGVLKDMFHVKPHKHTVCSGSLYDQKNNRARKRGWKSII